MKSPIRSSKTAAPTLVTKNSGKSVVTNTKDKKPQGKDFSAEKSGHYTSGRGKK